MAQKIDPKAYAARLTQAKKKVAAIDPAMKTKIRDMYPKISKEQIARQAIGGKDVSSLEKRMKAKPKPTAPSFPTSTGVKKPQYKKPIIKRPNAKPVPLAPAPKAPRRGTATPVPLAPAPKKTKGRITPMPKTTKR